MRKKVIDPAAIFQPIRGASEITGLSQKYIREGCRSGTIPCLKVGSDYRVNMPLWRELLDRASEVCGHS